MLLQKKKSEGNEILYTMYFFKQKKFINNPTKGIIDRRQLIAIIVIIVECLINNCFDDQFPNQQWTINWKECAT